MIDNLQSISLIGVFHGAEIEYLIAVASNSEVRLLGASVQASGDLSMYLTQISVSTDNVVFLAITPLSNGQLFLAGHDGHLYELEYEVSMEFRSSNYNVPIYADANRPKNLGLNVNVR
jgi:hypothetical protein